MEQELKSENKFRRYISWLVVIGTAISGTYFLGFLVYYSLGTTSSSQNWLIRVIENHYAATIGVPLSAISAFCVVFLLRVVNRDPIEFEVLGVKFKGTSGPVVIWIFCFLAIVFGMYLLWDKHP